MKKIFIGLLFIFFNFTFTFNNVSIGLIPNFVGYILMMLGCKELSHESDNFSKINMLLILMSVYSSIDYVLSLLGVYILIGGIVGLLIGIALVVINVYITYIIVLGVQDIEKNREMNLFGNKLKSIWVIITIFQLAVALVSVIVYLFPTQYMTLILLLSSGVIITLVVFNIIFLLCFNKTQKAYYGIESFNSNETTSFNGGDAFHNQIGGSDSTENFHGNDYDNNNNESGTDNN